MTSSKKKLQQQQAAAARAAQEEADHASDTASSALGVPTKKTLTQRLEERGLPRTGGSTPSSLPAPGAKARATPAPPEGSTSSGRASPEVPNDQSDSAGSEEDDDEGERSRSATPSAGSRGGTAYGATSMAAMIERMQRDSERRFERMLQQQLEQQRQHHQEALQQHLDRVRVLEERQAARDAVLDTPRLTVAESAPSATTARGKQAQESFSTAQQQPAAARTILATPARVLTPSTRPALRPESAVPEDDDDGDDDGDDPQGPPPNARGGRRTGSAPVQQLTTVPTQRTAMPLPPVEKLRQADLVQNGRVLLKWKNQMQDQIEVAEFNDGGVPYEYERRFLMARMAMDEGVRDFLNAHQNEAKTGRGTVIRSWDQLIGVLEAHYAPARDAEEALTEFYKATMKAEESMDQFLHRIGAVVDRIPTKDMAPHTASETVIRMIDDKRFPELLRIIKDEQRKHKLAHDGYGMEFLTLRQRLPDLARDEPNRGFQLQMEAMESRILRQLKGNGGGGKAVKQAEKVNAAQVRPNFSTMSDEELKKLGWSESRIKHYRDGGCFHCGEKGHIARECSKKGAPKKSSN
jgi:hypothetical protein